MYKCEPLPSSYLMWGATWADCGQVARNSWSLGCRCALSSLSIDRSGTSLSSNNDSHIRLFYCDTYSK
jgi:hypothetical protein